MPLETLSEEIQTFGRKGEENLKKVQLEEAAMIGRKF
jgi:hypothetical protein